jgi:hypothetical protein
MVSQISFEPSPLPFFDAQSHERIKKYMEEDIPIEYEKTLSGLTQILKETWIIIDKADTDERDRLMALALARHRYNIRLDLV